MTPRLRDLPRLVVLTATAFAAYEPRPAVGWVRLVRSLSLSVAYRWGTGHLLADPAGACLLWSDLSPRRRPLAELRGIGLAVATGLAMTALSTAVLMLPVLVLLDLLGAGPGPRSDAGAALLLLPSVLAAGGALRAYRVDARRARALPAAPGGSWRVDYLAALPAGRGAGGRLLDAFVRQADAAGVRVVLVADEELRSFYRRHGFRVQPTYHPALQGSLLMVRTPPVRRQVAAAV